MKHGYVFEVRPDASSSATPIVGMGRFRHEAVAIDPASGIVYMTEDDSGKSGFYRYIPKVKDGKPGSLAAGGVPCIDTQPPYRFEIDVASPVTDEVAMMIGDHHPEFELRGGRTFAFEHDEMAVAFRMALIVGTLAERGRVRHY